MLLEAVDLPVGSQYIEGALHLLLRLLFALLSGGGPVVPFVHVVKVLSCAGIEDWSAIFIVVAIAAVVLLLG